MASSTLLRCSLNSLMRARLRTTILPSTRNISSEIKWVGTLTSNPVITGPIIPFAEQNIIQNIIFPYTYGVMYYMDFLLDYTPWWGAIIGTVATVRLLFFPLVLKQNIVGIKIYNLLPETQKIQVKINEGMASGDGYKTALHRTQLKLLYDEHGVSVKQRLWPILVQAPAFMSIFLLLRRLTNEPIESMKTGGALWFTDLTIPDPFYILPLMTGASMFILMKYGLEGSAGPLSSMGPAGRWIMTLFPVGLVAIVHSFPAAVLLFWVTNNFFTMFYAIMLKQPSMKSLFNIPARLDHAPETLPLTNQTFSNQFKTAVDQGRARRTTLDVRRLDDIAFRKAGVGPLKKTYKAPPSNDDVKIN